MQPLILFFVTLLLMGAAFGIPAAGIRNGTIRDQDATPLGALVLAFGLGGMNLGALAWFAIANEISGTTLGYGVLPIIGGVLALRVARRRLDGGVRAGLLLGAAALTLLGFPGYFAQPLVAGVATAVTALLYLAGLVANPRSLLRTLDPRD